PITITLVNGTNSGVSFDVFTPSQIGDWWDEHPIGRGTPQAINCATGLPEDNGGCQANDLTWVGDFNDSGTYYVEVVNSTDAILNAQVTIQGSGVALAPATTAGATGTTQTTTT